MKAMIFAAGIGSRLGALTQSTPKCLIEVGGTPMLERVVGNLIRVGVTGVVINIHHHAEQVAQFVRSRQNFGIEVALSREEHLLDTGGGLKRAQALFVGAEDFIIHNADIFYTGDLSLLLKEHRSRRALATLMVMTRQSQRGLYFDDAQRLVGWTAEDTQPPPGAVQRGFCGISICSPELFTYMPDSEKFSLVEPFLAAARATQRVWGCFAAGDATWADIGTPAQLDAVRGLFLQQTPEG
jgi:NDP-sugar pyrophosphorylase family protein